MKFKTLQNFTFFSILIIVSSAFVYILLPYIMPIFWALILAVVFYPTHEKTVKHLKGKRALAATLSLIAIIFLLIIPASLLVALFINEASHLYSFSLDINKYGNQLQNVQVLINHTFKTHLDLSDTLVKFSEYLKTYGGNISTFAIGIGKTSFDFLVKFIVMLYVLFFFLKDGPYWTKRITDILPLGRRKEKYILEQFSKMVRVVFKGSFAVAFVQGVLGAILFAIVGIPSPIVWGAVMMLLAFIPAVGTGLVWGPAAIILFLLGNTTGAVILILGGVFLISMADNILRPYLLGKDTDMPDVLIFLSVLGAISIFGMPGVVIGPVFSALFLAVWELFEKEYKSDLQKFG